MKNVFFLLLVTQIGCASLEIRRKILDERGRELASVVVRHSATTASGAALLMAEARSSEEAGHEEQITQRVTNVAEKSVDMGQPTTLSTAHGSVQSGYANPYGQYGYAPYGYGQVQFFPGASLEMVGVEQAWQQSQSQGFTLPRLNEPIVSYPMSSDGQSPVGRGQCPTDRYPANLIEETACNRRDLNALIRAHRRRQK